MIVCTQESAKQRNFGLVKFLKDIKKPFCIHRSSALQKQEMFVGISENS